MELCIKTRSIFLVIILCLLLLNSSKINENQIKNNEQSSDIIRKHLGDSLTGTKDKLTVKETGYLSFNEVMWRNVSPSGPSERFEPSMAYNSLNQKVVLFGGYTGGYDNDYYFFRLDDTWVYDLPSNTWTQMDPSIKPSARHGHSMVFDSDFSKVILFGGGIGRGLDDTWVYDLESNTWTQMNPSTKPSARSGHSMVYDPTSSKVILFGGYDGSLWLNDTWIYDLLSDTWTVMNPPTKPNGRFGHSMVYDINLSKTILFGGDNNISPFLADTWIYDLPSNTWTQMNPSSKPSARIGHSMIYDSTFAKVNLFGGCDGESNFDDTWIYDLSNDAWTQMNPSTKPRARAGHSMVYDSNSDKGILFGGNLFDPAWFGNELRGTFFNDTWVCFLGIAVAPSAPLNLSATVENFILLNWATPSDDGGSAITHYDIYRGTISGSYFNLGTTINVNFNDTTVIGGTTYYYVVTAANKAGKSVFSQEVRVTPLIIPDTTIPPTSTMSSTTETTSTAVTSGFTLVTIWLLLILSVVLINRRKKNSARQK